MDESTKVYIKTDEQSRITAINSGFFITNLDGWIEIDKGIGDEFKHAQNNYLDECLFNEFGVANYKFFENRIVKRTPGEKEADKPKPGKSEFEIMREKHDTEIQGLNARIHAVMLALAQSQNGGE